MACRFELLAVRSGQEAPMSAVNVSLPAARKAWVEQQSEGGCLGNSSDAVRDLIRRDQARAAAVDEV